MPKAVRVFASRDKEPLERLKDHPNIKALENWIGSHPDMAELSEWFKKHPDLKVAFSLLSDHSELPNVMKWLNENPDMEAVNTYLIANSMEKAQWLKATTNIEAALKYRNPNRLVVTELLKNHPKFQEFRKYLIDTIVKSAEELLKINSDMKSALAWLSEHSNSHIIINQWLRGHPCVEIITNFLQTRPDLRKDWPKLSQQLANDFSTSDQNIIIWFQKNKDFRGLIEPHPDFNDIAKQLKGFNDFHAALAWLSNHLLLLDVIPWLYEHPEIIPFMHWLNRNSEESKKWLNHSRKLQNNWENAHRHTQDIMQFIANHESFEELRDHMKSNLDLNDLTEWLCNHHDLQVGMAWISENRKLKGVPEFLKSHPNLELGTRVLLNHSELTMEWKRIYPELLGVNEWLRTHPDMVGILYTQNGCHMAYVAPS